jgi:hypothetical protein
VTSNHDVPSADSRAGGPTPAPARKQSLGPPRRR